MVGVEVASFSSVDGPIRSSKEPSPHSSLNDQQQAMEAGDPTDDQWTEDASGFGIPDGALQLVEVPRRRWRRPMELPLPPPSPAEAPILQEFSRPWRALRLPLPPANSSEEEAEESLLKCYDPQYAPKEPTFASEIRMPSFLEPRVAVPESQALLVIPRIRFTLGTIEPLVCRMLVYDVSQNCRVTEEFCFRIPGPMLDKTDCTIPPAALMYLLPMKDRSPYLVLKVSKVLVGDGDVATGPYCAPDKFATPAEQQKLVDKAVDCGMRLGRFQQPLAWGVMPLVKGAKQGMTLYRQRACIAEEQRLSLVLDAIRGTLKEKVVPASCEFDVDDISAEELSMAKFKTTGAQAAAKAPVRLEILDPFSEQSVQTCGKPEGDSSEQRNGDKILQCREVQPLCPPSFVSASGIAASGQVAVSYVNTLYLYPLQIEKCQYRNVAICVQLLQREVDAVRGLEETEDAVLRAVYRANNQVGRSAYALVGYHQKNPQFEDEIKICLPVSLTAEHHVLLTFYHVHCKKLQPNQPQQELIGYAALPLLRKDGTIIHDGRYTVNVTPAPVSSKPSATGGAISLSPGYVGAVRDGVVDNTKTVFSCRSRVVSSVHSQDSAIAEFLSPFHGTRRAVASKDTNEDAIVKRLVGLVQSDAPNLRYYFFMITKFVLGYLRYGTSIVRWSAFRTLLTVIKKVTCDPHAKAESNEALQYVHIVFDEKSIDDPNDSCKSPAKRELRSVFGALLETWLNVLNNKTSFEENAETLAMSRTYSKVLLQLILKSMAMTLLDQRDAPDAGDNSLPMMLAKNDAVVLERVLVQLMAYARDDPSKDLTVKKDVNSSVAYFCRGIFLIVRNALPARVIDRCVKWVNVQGDAASLNSIWFPFLTHLVDFEFFPTVNGAVPAQDNNLTRGRAWLAKAVFVKLLLIVDKQKEHSTRVSAVRLLRWMFATQAYNPRFQSPESQEQIALLYYPFLSSIVQFTAPGKLLASRVGDDLLPNSFGPTNGVLSPPRAAFDLQKELVICVGHLLSSVSDLHLPLFFQLTGGSSDQLSFTEALSFYHRVIAPQCLNRLETSIAADNNSDGAHESPRTAKDAPGSSLYDEARVHASLALIQRMLEIFLVAVSPTMSDEVLRSRLLASTDIGSDTQSQLNKLEEMQRSRRQSFHRRGRGGLNSSAELSDKPNPIDTSSSPGEAVHNAAGGSPMHRSLPRNWSKQHSNIQQRRSAPNVGIEEKAPPATPGQDSALRGKSDEEVAALQQAVATTAFRAIQTAVDQYEGVLRLIEVARTPRFSTDNNASLHGVSTNQTLALLGYLTELLFELLQRASSIKGLAGELEQDGATDQEQQSDDPDDNATHSSTSCFVVTLLRYLQTFVWRFSAALFATRIPGLPAVHDQRRIQLLVSIAATATRVQVRHHAAMLLSQLLAVCYEQTGSFQLVKGPVLKVLTSVFFPLSSASDTSLQISTAALRDLLDEMRTFATTSRDNILSLPFSFHSLFIELLNDLTTKVHAFERWQGAYENPDGAHDFEEIEEGIDRVVDDISPHWLLQEKLIWLNALLRLHERREQFAEAACCKVASIECVQRAGLGRDSDSSHLGRLQQWVVRELFDARRYANRADWIEKELAISELLLVALKQQRRFNEYQETTEYMGALVRRLANRDESQHGSSSFSFYRVRFAGGCVPTLIAKDEFIYKRSKFTSLGEFVGEMKTMLRAKYPQCERVDVVPEPKPLTGGDSNPNVIYLRVTTVEEALPEELARLKTAVEPRSHHWRVAFKFAVPFTLGSASSYGKTSEQMKRLTYLAVARAFPCRLSRQRVRLRHEEVRCPIDNSMDDIQKRCALLQAEIDKGRVGKTDLKTLTLVLKGSVDTHVHGGIPEVLDSFLAADPAQLQLVNAEGRVMNNSDSARRRHELANLLVEFADLCWKCLKISRDAFRGAAQPSSGSQHAPPELFPQHLESKLGGPSPNAPSDSFLPPVSSPPSTGMLVAQCTAAPLARQPDSAAAVSLLEEVSPLQSEFDRSFAALVDQLATKIPFVFSHAGRLAELHQQTACLRSSNATPTPSRTSSFPAAVAPLPSSVS